MRNLQLIIYKSGDDARPEKTITIPLTALGMGMKLLPRKTRSTLEKEGIDLTQCTELIKDKDLKGPLIAIESTTEKLLISID